MTLTLIIILIAVGLLLLLVEVLIIPGTSVALLLGLVLMVSGIWAAYSVHGPTAGHYVLISTFLASCAVAFLALRGRTWEKFSLRDEITGKVNTFAPGAVKEGDRGRTISRLAPAGKAAINDGTYEVHSRGEFIDENTEIRVVKIEGSKIWIEKRTE